MDEKLTQMLIIINNSVRIITTYRVTLTVFKQEHVPLILCQIRLRKRLSKLNYAVNVFDCYVDNKTAYY